MRKLDPKEWDKAVTFQYRLGGLFTLHTTADAARYLLLRWPVEGGAAHRAARQACLNVLEGKEPPEVARIAFMTACEEVGMKVIPEEVFMRLDPGPRKRERRR